MDKQWYKVELSKSNSELFKEYLRKNDIKFEPSEAFNLVHFECLMNKETANLTNKWIDENLKGV